MNVDDLRSEIPYYKIAAEPSRFSMDHHADIARGAYFRAERRGFAPGRLRRMGIGRHRWASIRARRTR
jgi:hypothetical protein